MTLLVDTERKLTPDEAVEKVISAVWRGEPAVVVPSPPGAGKTGTVERVVYAIAKMAGRRVAVSCNTNAQVADVVTRIALAYPDLRVAWMARKGLEVDDLPEEAQGLSNLVVAHSLKEVAAFEEGGGAIRAIFATADKWKWAEWVSHTDDDGEPDYFADLLVIDEAWQCADMTFAHIAGIAPRYLMVGDPGQIAPVVTGDTMRWRHRPDGPHRPAPVALLERQRRRESRGENPVTTIGLPSTRRFGPDTVSFVQPAFYPTLPFDSVRPPRHLWFPDPSGAHNPVHAAALRLLAGLGPDREVLAGALPAATSNVNDGEMAAFAAAVVMAALDGGTVVTDDGRFALLAMNVGVVCAHISQVAAVQAALGVAHCDVWVDTAERWQGSERELMVVWDPFVGKQDLTDFSRDAGRLCVMASRHRSGCVFLTRAGADDILRFAATGSDRVLSDAIEEPAYKAWQAQTVFREALKGRTTSIVV